VAVAVPGLVVNRAVEQGSGRVDYFSAEELADRADRDAWQLGERIGTGPLRLAADRAEALGLAAHVVDDLEELKRAYGIDAGLDPPRSGWAEELLTALASPGLAWILLLVGGAGLYVELKTPGFGFGGFVAMVAFIVYFWSQYLHGTSGWLEVLLFLAGLVCLAAEIFVLPGFGVLGLGGGLLVIAALVLASQSFVLPANAYQVGQMQRSLAGILGAIAGVTVLGLVLRRWLPATPVLRHVFLEPPEPMAELAIDALAELVGRVGQATTRLAPAGKARLGGSIHDVTTDGDLIEPGTAVQVVAVQGGRIHVRRA
jgi:membrane-bound ClpP family serine protease